MYVSDVMRTDIPRVDSNQPVTGALAAMTRGGMGMVVVEGADSRIVGIFTDGDLRRLIETGTDMRQLSAAQVMHANPRTVRASALAAEAAELMELHRITSVLVVDDHGNLCGALNTNDLMRAKVI
jgi:arabinose-5-phosphate isomerase